MTVGEIDMVVQVASDSPLWDFFYQNTSTLAYPRRPCMLYTRSFQSLSPRTPMINVKAGRRLATIASLAAAAFVVACDAGTPVEPVQSALAIQSSRNADAAHACNNGGYANLRRVDGSAFKNVGECVSYAAKGGSFGPAIESFVLNGNNCFFGTYTAVFSGGTGVVNGTPVTSGVQFTIFTFVGPTLVVTSPTGVSVTATAPAPIINDGSCLV